MNQTELAETIKQLSHELHVLIEESLTGQGISALQQELIKSRCVALYDHVLQVTPSTVEVEAEAPAPIPLSYPQPEAEPEFPAPETIAPPPSLFNIPIPAAQAGNPVLKTEEKEEIVPEPVEKTQTELQNEIIDEIIEIREEQKERAELPKDLGEISLHEKIASVIPKTDLTDRFTSSLASLKSAINVNLKIAMVNDLFNENTVEYVKAIDKLNHSENINEAMRFFTELKHTYGWENDHLLVKELETLISKRFS